MTRALRSISEQIPTTLAPSRKGQNRQGQVFVSILKARVTSGCPQAASAAIDSKGIRQATWHGKLGEPTPVEQISSGITEGLARARICDLFASGIPGPHQPSPSPRPKRARPSIQRLHNIISDLIGLITISPVCAEHTLPLASPSTPSPPSLLTVVTIPRRFRPNRPTDRPPSRNRSLHTPDPPPSIEFLILFSNPKHNRWLHGPRVRLSFPIP